MLADLYRRRIFTYPQGLLSFFVFELYSKAFESILKPDSGFRIWSCKVCTTSSVGYANAARRGCKHPPTNRTGGSTTDVFQAKINFVLNQILQFFLLLLLLFVRLFRTFMIINLQGLHHLIRGVRERSSPRMQAYHDKQARRVNHRCFPLQVQKNILVFCFT